jgi:hypothetical protein
MGGFWGVVRGFVGGVGEGCGRGEFGVGYWVYSLGRFETDSGHVCIDWRSGEGGRAWEHGLVLFSVDHMYTSSLGFH